MKPENKEELYKLLDDSPEHVVGGLMVLYSFQTADEQMAYTTTHDNAAGFNMVDAGVMTDIAHFYEQRGFLTDRQISFVRRTIKKYHGQLLDVGVRPLPIKGRKKDSGKPGKKAEAYKKVCWLKQGQKLKVEFQFPQGDERFRVALANVKTLSSRKFNPEDKSWTVGASLDAVQNLLDWEFDLHPEVQEWLAKHTYQEGVPDDIEVPGLKKELYPFQRGGVCFVESRDGRALIADEMGLGKTAQALAWLQLHREDALPAIAIVPASVKLNWDKECRMWTDIPTWILSGRLDNPKAVMGTETSDGNDLTIINYDILDSWMPILKGAKFKTMIIDECHYIKSSKALRTKAVRKLAKRIPHVIALSGTPITNRPIEFFNTLNIIKPEKFPGFWKYAMEYCAPKHNGWGWDFTGASNTEKLHRELTTTIMVRRRKDQVLKDLPKKVRTVIPMELDNRKEYFKAQSDFLSWLREKEGVDAAIKASRAKVLVQIERLKQLAAIGKIKGAIGWIEDFLKSDQKLVVFCVHKNIVNLLMEEFKGIAVKIDGGVPTNKRLEIVEQFQGDDNIRLFVGNIRAAGVGITLTAASNTCFLELGWTPGEHDQAEDRVHRIGQEASSVNAWYLLADDTVENDIAHLIDKKRQVIATVLDGRDVEEEKILSELLYRMMEDQI